MESFQIRRKFDASAETVYSAIEDTTIFKLTGADEISIDFNENGLFELIFQGRGKIYGSFEKISKTEIVLCWNVGGFDRQDERETVVIFALEKVGDTCNLILTHSSIPSKESAAAKMKAWSGVIDSLMDRLCVE